MKKMNYYFLFLLFISVKTYAVDVKIIKPCSEELAINSYYQIDESKTLGDVTVSLLESLKVPYQGTTAGINSILNTPIGLEAYDVISDSEMLAYGWCFSINGIAPELMPDQIDVYENDEIVWWYGYAQYKNGVWITQCTPSYFRLSSKFCQDIHGNN
jgi:hypothetical protein